MLYNQEGLWKSNELWNFIFKEDLICIENINITGEFLKTNNVKRQQEDANSIFFSDKNKRWKLDDNNMLINKEGIWKSNDSWVFKPKDDDLIYIENTSKTKVLETFVNEVILADFQEDKAEQLWKKGKPDAEGFFTLENSKMPKFITAISESGLEIQGRVESQYKDF